MGMKVLAIDKKKAAEAVLKKGIQTAVNKAAGDTVPGVGGIVIAHVKAPYYAAKGDGLNAVAASGGFGGFAGAVIGTAIFQELVQLLVQQLGDYYSEQVVKQL